MLDRFGVTSIGGVKDPRLRYEEHWSSIEPLFDPRKVGGIERSQHVSKVPSL
jgi:hypothetical protein